MARISSYAQDSNITPEDRLVGSSYEGEGLNGPIYKTRTYKLGELGNFVSGYIGDVNVTDSPEFISLSQTVTNNTTSIASANQSITTITNDLLAQATFQTNLATSFGTYDEFGNLTSFSEATANQILQVTTSDRFAESVFVTNLAASVGTYDANGNLITLGQAFADQVLSATASDRFAEASFVTNLASSFGTYNPDGSIATLSEAFANQVVSTSTTGDYANAEFVTTLLSNFGTYDENGALVSVSESYANQLLGTANTSEFAQASYVTNLGASFGTLNPDGSVSFDNTSTYANSIINYVDSSSALATQVENLQTTVTNIPQTIRQDEPPDVNAYPLGSIWVDTNDGNAIYILIDGTPRTWEPTTSEALGDLILSNAQLQTEIDLLSTNVSAQALKTTTLTAQFGVYDPATNTFTIDNNANVISSLRTYADAESAAASKVDGINSVFNIVDANGNVIKNLATFNQEITTYVDANSATASAVTDLTATIGDENSGLVASVNETSDAVASKPNVYRQIDEPTGTIPIKSVWYDTDDNNKPYIYESGGWVEARDGKVTELETYALAQKTLIADANGVVTGITIKSENSGNAAAPISDITFKTNTFNIVNQANLTRLSLDAQGDLTISGTLDVQGVTIADNDIRIQAPTGFFETTTIRFDDSSGNVIAGINAGTSPDRYLNITANERITLSAGGNAFSIYGGAAANPFIFNGKIYSYSEAYFTGDIASGGEIRATGGIKAINSDIVALGGTFTGQDFILSSDAALKENIKEYTVKPINIQYKQYNLIGDDSLRVGVIAQEIEKDHPEFVKMTDNGTKAVSYIDMLVAKVAELEQRIKQLENGAA